MANADVLNAKLESLSESVGRMEVTMARVAEALERLARLEERQTAASTAIDRAFSWVSKIDARVKVVELEQAETKPVTDQIPGIKASIKALELSQPIQKLASSWVINAASAIAGGAAMFILGKIV